jgi:glycosyltransferase involved in cell wall biosynthesis
MRITFIVHHRNISGGVRVIAIYAERLKQRGHEVVIVARPKPVPSLVKRAKALFKGEGWLRDPNTFPTHLDKVDVEQRIIDCVRPIEDRDVPDGDVVIATWWETAPWVAALSPSKGAKAYFVQDFGANDAQPLDKLRETWRLPMHKIIISSYIRQMVREACGPDEPLSDVPNSVDTTLFHAPPRGKQPRPTIGTMYSRSRYKGTDLCFAGVEIARRTRPDIRVMGFAQDFIGNDLPLPSDSHFEPRVPDARLNEFYSGCDAWVFAPRKEGFGLPILEAMACRTPVIATPAGAAPEIVAKGGGILVPHADSEGIAAAILQISSMSDSDWRQMSDKALATVTGYTWDDATDLFEAALQTAVDRSAVVARATRP